MVAERSMSKGVDVCSWRPGNAKGRENSVLLGCQWGESYWSHSYEISALVCNLSMVVLASTPYAMTQPLFILGKEGNLLFAFEAIARGYVAKIATRLDVPMQNGDLISFRTR